MKVALMGRSLRGQFSGVVRYTDGLVRALEPSLGTGLNVLLPRSGDGLDGLSITRLRAPVATPNEYVRALWEQSYVPLQVLRCAPDVYHSPNYILPLGLTCPTVVTIHDITYLDRTVHKLRSHLYLSLLTALALRKAKRVICVSAYTEKCLLNKYPSLTGKTRVIGEGVSAEFRPQSAERVAEFRASFDIAAPYVLFVGTIEPRKNLPRLIEAFSATVREQKLPHDLVLIGAKGWKDREVWQALENSQVRERIKFLGYVPDSLLPAAYAGADCFAYPSLQEGYGLPPIEAMACGTPVLTSNCSSIPDIVGDAALLVDPTNESALAAGLQEILTSKTRRETLIEAGLRQASLYNWRTVASETIKIYEEACA